MGHNGWFMSQKRSKKPGVMGNAPAVVVAAMLVVGAADARALMRQIQAPQATT